MRNLHSKEEMLKTGIYQISNLINNKIYIGSTQKNFRNRLWEHYSDLRRNAHGNNYFQKAYNKYGEDNFLFSIIEYVSPENCIAREQYYLDTKNPFKEKGYNLYPSARGGLGYKHSKETKEKMSEIGKKKPINPIAIEAMKKANTGRKSPDHVNKRMSEMLSKPVIQLSLEGIFIREWKSCTEATLSFGVNSNDSNIAACTRGKCKSARGFLWVKKENYIPNQLYSYNNKQGKVNMIKVNQYDLEGNFIKEWESSNKAAKFYNIGPVGIYNCVKNKAKTCIGYKWSYK